MRCLYKGTVKPSKGKRALNPDSKTSVADQLNVWVAVKQEKMRLNEERKMKIQERKGQSDYAPLRREILALRR